MSVSNFACLNLTANSVSGVIVANNAEILTTISNKVITPASLQQYLKSLNVTIGQFSTSDAIFNNLSATTIGGTVVASNSEVSSGTINNKVITPSSLRYMLNSGIPIGSSNPSSGTFSDLIITNSITIGKGSINPVNGGTGVTLYTKGDILVASNSNTLTRLSVGTQGQLLMVDTSQIGALRWSTPQTVTNASTSSFGIVQIATNQETLSGQISNKVITPNGLNNVLLNPPIIGSVTPNSAIFNNITIKSITGANASTVEAVTGINSSKYITPSNISSIFASPKPIGSNTANSGIFTNLSATTLTVTNLNVLNPPWSTTVINYATNSESVIGILNNKVICPATLKFTLESPPPIGFISPNDGYFKNLTIDNINISNPPWTSLSPQYATNQDAINQQATNLSITPSNLTAVLSQPSQIGNINPNTGSFTIVNATEFNGQVGNDTLLYPGYFTNIVANTLDGPVIATDNDVHDGTASTLVLTPSNLTAMFSNPRPIGVETANIGVFTDVTMNTISGNVIASLSDLETGSSNSLIVTPNVLINYLSTAASLVATNLTANTISGSVIATLEQITEGVSNLIVTPDMLNEFLSSPNIIGNVSPNIGYFTDIHINNLYGCEGVLQDAQNGTSDTLFISPRTLCDFFSQPRDIGDITPANGNFLNINSNSITVPSITATTLQGSIIADDTDVSNGQVNYLVITPLSLFNHLSSPNSIGNGIPNTGAFTTLTCQAIGGSVLATSLNNNNDNTTVITPQQFNNFWNSPSILGSVSPSDGTFINLNVENLTIETANIVNDNITNAYISSLGGSCTAGNVDVNTGTATNMFISPATFAYGLQNPIAIGSGTPNTGIFTDLSFNTVSGNVIASNISDASVNQLVSPFSLINYLGNMTGDIYSPQANFNICEANEFIGPVGNIQNINNIYGDNLNINTIQGNVLAELQDIDNGTAVNLVITPLTLYEFLNNPGYNFGSGTSNLNFNIINGQQFYGSLGDQSNRNNITSDIIDSNTYQGTGVVTSINVVNNTAVGSQIISLDALNTYFSYPKNIGDEVPASGTFTTLTSSTIYGPLGNSSISNTATITDLTCNTINGNVIASYLDIINEPSNNQVVSPVSLLAYLDSPHTIGSSTPSNAYFTTINSNIVYGQLGDSNTSNDATINNLVCGSITGSCFDSYTNLINGITSTNSIVSSTDLLAYLTTPSGNGFGDGSGTGNFNNLIGTSVSGDMIAEILDLNIGTSNNLIVTPYLLTSYISNIPSTITIGGVCNAEFNNLVCTSISGAAISVLADINTLDPTEASSTTLLTPLILREYLSNPAPFGSILSTIGSFYQVDANTLYGTLGDLTSQSPIYASDIRGTTISGSVIAEYSDYETGTANNLIVTPHLLNYVMNNVLNINAESSTFTNLSVSNLTITDTILNVPVGGTGHNLFNNGDLLIGNNSYSLDKLPIGSNQNVIVSNGSTLSWNQSPYPNNFINIDSPLYISGSSYSINYSYARDSTNMYNLNENLPLTLSSSSNIFQSDSLASANCTGTTITFNDDVDPTTIFIKGDVISFPLLSISNRVVSVTALALIIDTIPVGGDFSNQTCIRGGLGNNVHYYIYLSSDNGYILSTRSSINNDQLIEPIVSSSYYRQLPYTLTTDGDGNFSKILYSDSIINYLISLPLISVTDTFVEYDLSLYLPKTSRGVNLRCRMLNNSGSDNILYLNNQQIIVPDGCYDSTTITIDVDLYQRINVKLLSLDTSWADFSILGYIL